MWMHHERTGTPSNVIIGWCNTSVEALQPLLCTHEQFMWPPSSSLQDPNYHNVVGEMANSK